MEEYSVPTDQENQEAYEYFEAVKTLPTIAERKDVFVKGIKDQIMAGYMNPLEFYRQAKIAIDCLEELKKDPEIFDCAYTERDKYGKEKPVVNGSVIDTGQRTTYDYKSCNDPEWNRLTQALKDREAFLKALKKEMTVVDTETGETVTIQPPTLRISNYISVKI